MLSSRKILRSWLSKYRSIDSIYKNGSNNAEYEELGGHAITIKYIKPTMIFEFHKDLTKPSKVASQAPSGSSNTALGDTQTLGLEENLQDLQLNSDDFEILSTVSSEAPSGPIGGLISELFTALRKEQHSSE